MCRQLDRPFENLNRIEKDLVFDFVGYFSRLEYSLKRAEYIRVRNGTVEADWEDFAVKNQLAFEGCNLDDLCPTLYRNPPMKQVVGEIGWREVPPQGSAASLLTLSLSLRRAQNNLFHGGKYHGNGVHGFDRSNDLLGDGIALIKHLALLDDRVLHFWNYD